MKKKELINRLHKEEPLKGSGIRIAVDELIEGPDIIGIYKENGTWKIYATNERGGHYIIDEYIDENKAYDEFYEHIYIQKKWSKL